MGSGAGSHAMAESSRGFTADVISRRAISERHGGFVYHARRGSRLQAIVAILILTVILAAVVNVWRQTGESGDLPASSESTLTLPMNVITQHKDTVMPCVPDGPSCPPGIIHAWNDASGADGIYGTPDDCPHCSCYCAPASIAMIASYWGFVGVNIQQDDIYDAGKSVGEIAVGDKILSTHGVGMFDGLGGLPTEVQASFMFSIGPFTQHDWAPANPNGPMTPQKLVQYLALGHPVLWLDHGGFPAHQNPNYPSESERALEGHAKVISGYDDNDTLLNTSDDLCLIYDPWPEYLDKSVLPTNATLGPGNSYDPYWLPLNDVNLSDPADIYLVDNLPDIAEFSTIVIPVLGLAVIAAVCIGIRSRENGE
jgi:hypothetical protein